MRGLSGGLFALVLCAVPLCALADPTRSLEHALNVRALQPLPINAVRVIAEYGTPTILARSDYPEAGKFSAEGIIDVLCGSYRDSYWKATVRLNKLVNVAPSKVLGERVYSIEWPACAYVIQPAKGTALAARNKTTAAQLYTELTGAKGSDASIRYYFRDSHVADVSRIPAGAVLTPSHVTLAKQIKVKDEEGFLAAVDSATLGNEAKFLVVEPALQGGEPVPTSVPRTQLAIAAGHIESAAYVSPAECGPSGANGPVLDVVRILNGYGLSRRAAIRRNLDQYSTDVFVADNGFFGARRAGAGVEFGPSFPESFFFTSDRYSDGQIGPVIRSPQQGLIYPINYSNDIGDPNFVSGHGTHVVGLILGGELFHSHLDLLRRSDGLPWLHVVVLNIGNGSAELLPGSEQQLDYQVELQKNKIVNLSLEYSETADQAIQMVFAKMMTSGEQNQNLFVVAAGNDGIPDVLSTLYYPAAFGGAGLHGTSNVISVAAHRPDGSLAAFSNRGAESIDLAAPGCDLQSWIDDSAQVVTLSGTSQAAAIVTFAAALIRSLGNFDPYSIKGRLMTSGDLLKAPEPNADSGLNPAPTEIMSRSRLNLGTALYLFDDYVRYRLPEDARDREVLGHVDRLTGVRCANSNEQVAWSDVWALKEEASEAWLYKGRGVGVVRSPCKAFLSDGAAISVHVRVELGEDGSPTVERGEPVAQALSIPLSSVQKYVAKMPVAHF